jgi:hypothetical protein
MSASLWMSQALRISTGSASTAGIRSLVTLAGDSWLLTIFGMSKKCTSATDFQETQSSTVEIVQILGWVMEEPRSDPPEDVEALESVKMTAVRA